MYMRKGKVVFGFKDTFSMEDTLRSVIYEGVKKYKEVTETNRDMAGIPMTIIDELTIKGLKFTEDSDYVIAKDYWCDALDEILWTFSAEEPDIKFYNFGWEKGFYCRNKKELERYNEDIKDFHERRNKGYELFGKYLSNLNW